MKTLCIFVFTASLAHHLNTADTGKRTLTSEAIAPAKSRLVEAERL